MEAETLQRFESYAFDLMSESEKQAFEADLVSDPGLKAEFEEFLHIVNGIRAYEREKIRGMMRESKLRSLQGGWSSLRRVAVAAAIILLLVIPGYVIFRMTTVTSRLAKEYYIEDPGLPVKMGASTNRLLDEAMIEYKDKQYRDALEKIGILKADSPDNDTLNYYAGICHFELGENEKAVQSFSSIVNQESNYYYQAKYNLGLAFIKLGKTEDAISALREVAEKGQDQLRLNAMEILEKL